MKVAKASAWEWSLAAALCFASFAALGAYVSSRAPTELDVLAGTLRGQDVVLAEFFTALGRWYAVAGVALAAAAVALLARANVAVIGALVVSQALSQGVSFWFKGFFGRARPADWLVFRETDASFPSGHAVTSIVFYLTLGVMIVRARTLPRPFKLVSASALALCVVGIPWSRLALAAHYFTDVVGGLLLGVAWVCSEVALIQALRASTERSSG